MTFLDLSQLQPAGGGFGWDRIIVGSKFVDMKLTRENGESILSRGHVANGGYRTGGSQVMILGEPATEA